jgi:hypothetical protein
MISKKPYFPNDIEGVMLSPMPDDITVDDFFEYRLSSWAIPSSIACVIRASNTKTGKVQEFSYTRIHAAKKKIEQLAKDKDLEIIIADDDSIIAVTSDMIEGRANGGTD